MRDLEGYNILLDLYDCPVENLEKVSSLKKILGESATKAGFTVVGRKFHQFKPKGATGIVLLASSHISAHTWPELRFVAIDVYSCKGKDSAKKAVKHLIDFFRPKSYEIREIERFR
ncbi:S-adenosylmethionine decarboxylase proenzyme [Candidatus Micrarchaeota archaeon RBG_16_49_10]|nr:MAG: S-adenosylmethionine decarboxylase proenzyme [Candidatus Micrarchaeota archaeon RBG_16_49_10]